MSETEETTPAEVVTEPTAGEVIEEATAPAAAKPEPPKPAPPKPATGPTQAQVDELQRKLDETASNLKKVNAESADRRKKLEALEREQESEAEKRVREAVEAAELKNKPRIVKAEAKLALSAADALSTRVKELTAFLDLDKVQIGDDDEVTGLEGQVAELKTKYPEWFKADEPETPVKPPTPKIPVGNKPPADKPRTIGEQIAASRSN